LALKVTGRWWQSEHSPFPSCSCFMFLKPENDHVNKYLPSCPSSSFKTWSGSTVDLVSSLLPYLWVCYLGVAVLLSLH
jgi:hypothetical protein